MAAPDANSPQVLARMLTEQEAALIVNHLNSLGIRAEVLRDDAATYIPAPPDVRVLVRQADLDRAKEALHGIRGR